jgi:polysaccharide export outer membrane protein
VRPATDPDAIPSVEGPPQERVVFTLDLTKADGLFSAGKFLLQSGDLVYVTESPLGTANTIVGFFGNLILARNRLQ